MMYSPVVVAGSNTHNYNMAKQQNIVKKKKAPANHRFVGVREAILIPELGTGVGSVPLVFTSAAGGNGNVAAVLTSIGLSSVTLVSGSFTTPAAGVYNISRPLLRGMYNRAIDFQWYRVTRAKFVFVSNLGSTTTGTITMAAYTDPADVSLFTNSSALSGPNTRTFDLANGASKELSVPVPVDSSWKKVTSELSTPGNVYPFPAATATVLAVLNTVNDLSFGAVQVVCNNAPASTALGTLFLDYDVEYKNPIDSAINI
jgi:hypothetical protein